jgi:hypothetical protein
MSFIGLSAGPHHQDHPAVVGGILESGSLLPYSLDLNSLDFSIWLVLKAKGQAMPHTNLTTLHPSTASGSIHLQKLLLVPPPPASCR